MVDSHYISFPCIYDNAHMAPCCSGVSHFTITIGIVSCFQDVVRARGVRASESKIAGFDIHKIKVRF